MDWATITYILILAVSNIISVIIGSRISKGESAIPSFPRKLEIIESGEEPEDQYGEIFPKDRIPLEDEKVI